MIKLKQLEKIESDYLANLSVPELKSYIIDLATEYYISISSKDNAKIKSILDTFSKLKSLNEEMNVEAYINYALITVFIKVVLNSTSAVNLKEPKLIVSKNKSKSFYYRPTEFEKVVEHYEFEKIFEREEELTEANLSDEEILELYNFNDYYTGNPEEIPTINENKKRKYT